MHTNSINFSIYKEDDTINIDNKDGYDKIISDTCFPDSALFDQKENIIDLFNNYKKLPNPSLTIKPIEPLQELEKLHKTKNDSPKNKRKIMEKEILPQENNKKKFVVKKNDIDNSTKEEFQNNQEEINLTQRKKHRGRKKKGEDKNGKHNKYCDDNIRRKCKHIVLNYLMEFINKKIRFYSNGNFNNQKEIKIFNHTQKSNAKADYNRMFLNKTLGQIFSENISTRYTQFPQNHNKDIIKKLESEGENKRYFQKLFSLTFLQSINHFIGIQPIKELNGMKCFNEIKEQFKDEENYDEILYYYLRNFEAITNNKKSRKSRENIINNNND